MFKKQWRERYFILNHDTGILSYYLLPKGKKLNQINAKTSDNDGSGSESEQVPINDLIPRGKIYLPGCVVSVKDSASNSHAAEGNINLLIFTIEFPTKSSNNAKNGNTTCFLSAANETDRAIWVRKISAVCVLSSFHKIDNIRNRCYSNPDIDDASVMSYQRNFQNCESEHQQNLPITQPAQSLNNTALPGGSEEFSSNLPPALSERISYMVRAARSLLIDQHEDEDNNGEWTKLCEQGGVRAVQRKQGNNAYMIRVRTTLPHRRSSIRETITDVRNKPKFDSRVQHSRLLHCYDAHTSLDYYATKPMFSVAQPDSAVEPRDFCVITHWQESNTSTDSESNGVLVVSFSHEDERIRCPESNHSAFDKTSTRANSILSAWWLESPNDDESSTNVRALFSTDLNGDMIPKDVVDRIVLHEAMLPTAVDDHLSGGETPSSDEVEEGDVHGSVNTVVESENTQGQARDSNEGFGDRAKGKQNVDPNDDKALENALNEYGDYSRPRSESNVSPSMSTGKDSFTKSMKKNNLEESANLQLTKHQTRVEPNLETHGTKKVEKRVSSPVPKKVALAEDEMKSDTVTHSVIKSPSSKAVVSCFVLLFVIAYLAQRISFGDHFDRTSTFVFFCLVFAIASDATTRRNASKAHDVADMIPTSGDGREDESSEASISYLVVTLLFPSLSWYVCSFVFPERKELVFVVALFCSARRLVLGTLGPPAMLPDGSDVGDPFTGHPGLGTGAFTGRFTVDLKGVLRFLGHKREELREEILRSGGTASRDEEIAVHHIVVKAAAIALTETPELNVSRVKLPLLGVRGCWPRRRVDVSVATGAHRLSSSVNRAVLLRSVDAMADVRDVANRLAAETTREPRSGGSSSWRDRARALRVRSVVDRLSFNSGRFGACVVLTSPNAEHSDVDVEVAPCPDLGVNVVVVVGGVRASNNGRSGAGKSLLSMSVSIDCPLANAASCRRFAERLQQLVQFPETCEERIDGTSPSSV